MGMTVKEQKMRAQINNLIRSGGVIHGGLIEMARNCGKIGCRCNRGEKHVSLYLGLTQKGKTRTVYIPDELGKRVREWMRRYKDIREVLEELSEMHWGKIRKQKVNNQSKRGK